MPVIGKYVLGNSEVKKYSVDYSGWLSTGELIVGVTFDVGLAVVPALTITDSVIDDTGAIVTFYAQGGDGKNVIPVGINITTSFAQIKTDTINFASQVALGPGAPAGSLIVSPVVVGVFGTPTSGQLAAWSGSNVLTSGNLTGEVTTAGFASTINRAITPVWTGLHTFGRGISLVPGGIIQGINSNHNANQTVAGSSGFPFFYMASPTYCFNQITAIDQVNVTTGVSHGMSAVLGIGMETGGPTSQGTKVGLEIQLVCDIPGANPTYGRDRACISLDAFDSVGDGGTGLTLGTAKGTLFSAGLQTRLAPGANNVFTASCAEANVGIEIGASAYSRFGLSVVGAYDIPAASIYDCAYEISSMTTGGQFKYGLMFTGFHGAFGVRSDGTLIGTDTTPSVALNGIDMSYVDFNGGYSIKSGYAHGGTPGVPNFSVDSTGAVVAQQANFGGFVAAGQCQALGPSASLVFQDRTGSTQWQWYATSNITRLYDGAGDVLSVDTSGNMTLAGGLSLSSTAAATLSFPFGGTNKVTLPGGALAGAVPRLLFQYASLPTNHQNNLVTFGTTATWPSITYALSYQGMLVSIIDPNGVGSLFTALRTTDWTAGSYDPNCAIRITAHDNASFSGDAIWGTYDVAERTATASAAHEFFQREYSFHNMGASVISDPFNVNPAGFNTNLRLDSGVGNGTGNPVTNAIDILNNGAQYNAGINIGSTAIITVGGLKRAIQLAEGNCLAWFHGAGNLTGALYVDTASFFQVIALGANFTMGGVLSVQMLSTGIKSLTYSVGSNQVVGARVTGYTAMTGTPDKASTFATGSVTLAQLAGRVMQLQADLTAHGLIGT